MTVWTRVTPHGMMSFDMSLIVGSVRYLFVTDRTLEQGGMRGLKVRVETRWSIKQPGAVGARMSGAGAAAAAGGRADRATARTRAGRLHAAAAAAYSSLLSLSASLFFCTEKTRDLDADTRLSMRLNKLTYLVKVWMYLGNEL